MRRLLDRGEQIGFKRAEKALDRVGELAREIVPDDVTVEVSEDGLRLIGQRLRARAFDDARLGSFGLMLREMLR